MTTAATTKTSAATATSCATRRIVWFVTPLSICQRRVFDCPEASTEGFARTAIDMTTNDNTIAQAAPTIQSVSGSGRS